MKTIRIIVVTGALLVRAAHANLIDLTPGGFNIADGIPPAFRRLITQTFFDEGAHGYFQTPNGTEYFNSWVSRYGALNGGTYFFTDLFDLGDTPTASVSWNFGGAPNGCWLSTIDVFGTRPDGTASENIYRVPYGERFTGLGDLVTLDGSTTIMGISFYGLDPTTVPEEAHTGALLLLAVSAIFLAYRTKAFLPPRQNS